MRLNACGKCGIMGLSCGMEKAERGDGMRLKSPVDFTSLKTGLKEIYGTKDANAKGRLISLGSGLVTAVYNVFITGIFYTGFLSMYGISITGVGIITFIPYIASCFSIFSSVILDRLKHRKAWLVGSKIYFYAMYIIATNLMPVFVTDPDARLVCFVAILFLAYSVYALFSPGFTTWFYRFYPEDNERRTRYIVYNQLFSSVMSSLILIFSSVLTDAVADSPIQNQLILGLRYFAFALVILDVSMQARAKMDDDSVGGKVRLREVFTLPFRYKKFIYCLLMMFAWNYVCNLNNGLWSFHLLNHLHFSYTLINAMSVMYTVIFLLTSKFWRTLIRRYSWIKTFGMTVLVWVPSEIVCFFMSEETGFLYVPVSVWQNLLNVGLNLSYANILYMNLPEEKSGAHIAFYTIGCNVFAFLGLITGTFVSSLTGDGTIGLFGMQVYGVQFTTLMRAVILFAIGYVLARRWRMFTRDSDIADVEEMDRTHRKLKEIRKRQKKAMKA